MENKRKKITVTKGEALEIFGALQLLSQQNIKAWYPISRNIQRLKPFIKELDEDKLIIQEKFGEKDEQGRLKYIDPQKRMIDITIENRIELDKLWEDLKTEEISVEIYQIKVEELPELLNPHIAGPLLDVIIID